MTTDGQTTPDHPARERGTRSRCKVLCRVVYDAGDEHCRASFGIEIVNIDGKPAIEIWEP